MLLGDALVNFLELNFISFVDEIFVYLREEFVLNRVDVLLGRTHEKQWIRRSESTSAKREWIWIYESTAFEGVLRLNTPQTNRHFYDWVSCS